jgi:hypothetical protein
MYRDGPIGVRRRSLCWFRVAVLVAACAAVVLMASGIWLWHTDTPGSQAACPICHVAHMPVLLGTFASVPSVFDVVASLAPAVVRFPYSAPVRIAAAPRAPPL